MKMGAMKIALEELNNPDIDEGMENDVVGAVSKLEDHLDGHNAVDAANEKMEQLSVAAESFGGFNEATSAIVGDIRGSLLDISQYFVLVFKQQKDFFSDLFRNSQGKIAKYEEIIGEADTEFKQKSRHWENDMHGGSSGVLWEHFATDQGIPARELPSILKKDLEMSKYVLTDYPVKVLEQLKKLTSAVRSGNVSTTKKAVSMLKTIDKIEHPVGMFNKKYFGSKSYFGVTGLEEKTAKMRPVLTVDGDTFSGVAELATPSKVIEDWSGYHVIKKLASKAALLPGPAFHAQRAIAGLLVNSSTKSYELTTNEIGELISSGQKYLDNVGQFLKLESRFVQAIGEFDHAIQTLINTADDDMSEAEQAKIKQIVKQVIGLVHLPRSNGFDNRFVQIRYHTDAIPADMY